MSDLEQRLRGYGRDVIDRVPPVALDEVGFEAVVSELAPPSGTRRGRSWMIMTVAAAVLVTVAAVAVVHRSDPGDSFAPAAVPGSVVDAPTADTPAPPPGTVAAGAEQQPDVDSSSTSIGTISWTIVEGESAELPYRIIDGSPSTELLAGTSVNGDVMLSADGGRTWAPMSPDVRTSRRIGGIEWRLLGDNDLAVVFENGSETPVVVPDAVPAPPAPWTTSTMVVSGWPIEFDGGVYAFAVTTLSVRFDEVLAGLDVGTVRIELDARSTDPRREVTWNADGKQTDDDVTLRAVEQPAERLVELVDADGTVVAVVDANLPGFEDVSPAELLFGASVTRWLRFDGTSFAPADSPVGDIGTIELADLDHGVVVLNQQSPYPTAENSTTLWRTDGNSWTNIALPAPTATTERSGTRNTQWWSLEATNEGAVITGYGPATRHYLIRGDGALEPIELPANATNREPFGSGWVSLVNEGIPVLYTSADGVHWERITLKPYYDDQYRANGATGQMHATATTIYITIDDHDGNRTLLIGNLT